MEHAARALEGHYDKSYFAFQQPAGRFGGLANARHFRPFIGAGARLVDFGCGGGYLLAALGHADCMGVEVNPAARAACRAQGISVVGAIDEVPAGWADIVISNHALEHVRDPFATVAALFDRLGEGGRAVVVVPWERGARPYDAGDTHRHLYTWHPQGLGNLFAANGFRVERVEEVPHRWPPGYMAIQRFAGWHGFHAAARLYGRLRRDVTQVRIVARKT